MSTEQIDSWWARSIASDLAEVSRALDAEWLTAVEVVDRGEWGYSHDQAAHILRQAWRYGALDRKRVGRTYAYRAAP